MNLENFCQINPKELIRRRKEYEKSIKQKCDLARKRYFKRRTHSNLVSYQELLKKLNTL